MTGHRCWRAVALALALGTAACSAGDDPPGGASASSTGSRRENPTEVTGKHAEKRERSVVVTVRYRIERRVQDAPTEGFADVVRATLNDPRGWSRAGFRLVEDPGAEYVVVLAEGGEVDRLCFPYETGGRFSCQNGPVVALNADRWRVATDKWTGDLATYRQMLVNHEVGHLLGQHHPDPQCPVPGRQAPVMAQQSTELNGCLANPWPLAAEIRRAARHVEPLAPPYEDRP